MNIAVRSSFFEALRLCILYIVCKLFLVLTLQLQFFLFVNFQEIHRQTCKYYATYNALLEIKELMLKETSLLNSLNSQV